MKKILFSIAALVFAQISFAQLANTSWSGNFNIPDQTPMVVEFKSDSLIVSFTDKTVLESMKYKINNDTLSIVKLEGQSPCSLTSTATYKVTMKDKKLFIALLDDDCFERSSAWPTDGLEKID